MKRKTFSLLPAIFFWLGSCCIANGQEATGDQITDGSQQIIQDDKSVTGKFQPVTVDPGTTTNVKLQFPTSAAGKTVSISPLDGGIASTNTLTIDQNGSLSFSFQVTDQPGVYRVAVIDPSATDNTQTLAGLVQFEVPNPAQ